MDEKFHPRSELQAYGPSYQVIGVARDIRGAELNGSDSRQLYLPMPEDRLTDYPILDPDPLRSGAAHACHGSPDRVRLSGSDRHNLDS